MSKHINSHNAPQAQEAFLEGHVLALEYFGLVPGRVGYDNLKPAVVRVLCSRDRAESERFIALRLHYGFDPSSPPPASSPPSSTASPSMPTPWRPAANPTGGTKMTCAETVKRLLKAKNAWEVRSAGQGSKGERWYAWAWLATASRRHPLLVRRHLKTGELAFCYCFVPQGQLASKARLIRAAGLRWPVEESFELGKDCLGLDQCQARLYTAILRHIVLVMAALAVCVVTAAWLRDRTDTQAPPPASPDATPPADHGLIPLTIREIRRLLTAALTRPNPPGHAARWLEWRRRHQARSRWFHKRARLERNYALVS